MTTQWKRLLSEAVSIMDHAERKGADFRHVTFGGGTAMMLKIDHRDSHDIDLFLSERWSLKILNDVVKEMETWRRDFFREGLSGVSLKVTIDPFGEIDFINARRDEDDYFDCVPGRWEPASEWVFSDSDHMGRISS